MRTTVTVGAVLLLAVGVGRGDPPSGPGKPVSPAPVSAPLPSLPPIPAAEPLQWKKPERVDTPAKLPPVEKPAAAKGDAPPADAGGKADARKLKEEVEKLLKEQTGKGGGGDAPPPEKGGRDDLLKKLDEMVDKIEQQKKAPKSPPPAKPHDPHDPHPPSTPPKPVVPGEGKPVDLLRAAGNLYKAGDLASAAEALKLIDTAQLPKEDRAFADYLRAACLRKQGRTDDALKLYRAIADAKDDPFLSESAVVQITAIQSARELEAQLEQLKSRRKPK